MVVRVVAIVCLLLRATAYDPACAAIPRARRGDCVLVVVAAGMPRQQTLAIAEHDAVLFIRKRAARFDQPQRLDRLPRQLGDADCPRAIAARLSDGRPL